ncbi:arylamine N-acetyltransferase family protein [Actinoplanes teichomyceticus]|uniref:Arylamine N-acetyltransferase n=1 Tax=Actinoplanes teichomyceticus TaxID=1867 RepID=A0A561WBL6_ACTTI|nr:arylamine N-acetyltransferase [Actinoplanes teichomyceticus]TWG21262.1 arylamine N-acetyltransferase [Actinoplanes teichomyceticus]GIF16725.1 arylamine N-acetyltransferase [Actinoplanes teichomyceticus]
MRLDHAVVSRYLARLGLRESPARTPAGLALLHERHVQRISYENIDIQLGRPTTVRPEENAVRTAGGRGGYCFHLNGSFAALLATLGFPVVLHRGQVKKEPDPPYGVAVANHLTLTVELGGTGWLVDVGLGDGLLRPVPLRPGVVHQPPLTFRLSRTGRTWRFVHDPRGSFTVMDWTEEPAEPGDFAGRHRFLSTDPESTFVRRFLAMNRDRDRVHTLVDRKLARIDADGQVEQQLDSFDEWRDVLADTFRLRLDAVDLHRLWRRLHQTAKSGAEGG